LKELPGNLCGDVYQDYKGSKQGKLFCRVPGKLSETNAPIVNLTKFLSTTHGSKTTKQSK
jgi:hypothetical protein